MAKAKRIYRAHPHASFGDTEAAWIGQQFDEHGGELTPDTLVQLSKPKSSPGHSLFIWDDAEAGKLYRVELAKYHLRHLQIEIVDQGNKRAMRACFPVFHEDREAGAKRSHVAYDNILAAPDLARQVVEKAAHELKAWQSRYVLYKRVFGSVFSAIEELESELWPPQKRSIASRKTAKRKPAKKRRQSQKR